MKRILTNGFTLLVPVLLWNLLFAAQLPHDAYSSNAGLAPWLTVVETALRIAVFGFPLLLTMKLTTRTHKLGLALYLIGSLLYYGAWVVEIVWPGSSLAGHTAVILAPYTTPLIFMTGIGLMGDSLLYIAISVVFTIVHTFHGLVSFGFISAM